MSVSSALIGIIEGLATSVDTGAESLITGLGQTRTTAYLTARAIIDVAQEIDLSVTAALWEQAGAIPVAGPVVAQLIDGVGTIGYQGLDAVDLAIQLSSQLAVNAAQFVPLQAAALTNLIADTVVSLLSAVPAPLAAASAGAPLPEAAVGSFDAAPVADSATKVISDAAIAVDGAHTDAVSSELDGQHTPQPAATSKTAESPSAPSTPSPEPTSEVAELSEKAAATDTLTVSSIDSTIDSESSIGSDDDSESSTDSTTDNESSTDSSTANKSSSGSSSSGTSSSSSSSSGQSSDND